MHNFSDEQRGIPRFSPVQGKGSLPDCSGRSSSPSKFVSSRVIPAQTVSLIGRDRECKAVRTLLMRPEVRLLTLTGTGGVGKTRLALAVAGELAGAFADGVYFVSLAPFSTSDLVLPTIVSALGLREASARPPLDVLKAFLRDKNLLLLLDNFEQVVDAASLLTELLSACSKLVMLVTSRAALHARGEHEFPLHPLELPDLRPLASEEDLSSYAQSAAIALFVLRAQSIKPGFQLTRDNAPTIAAICKRLDGLPLALELAAAHIKQLPPHALLARLARRFDLLTSEERDIPARQQTLRNTLQWSYDLLNAREQRLFRALSIFPGGCRPEALEAVCTDLGEETGMLLDEVTSLLDKSLIRQSEQADGEPRFMMLETVREYGLERLQACGEMERVQSALAQYFVRLAEEVEPELLGADQVRWFVQLGNEIDNLRAVRIWSSEHDVEKALRIGAALWRFWQVRGQYLEGYQWLSEVLPHSEGVSLSLQAKALDVTGSLAMRLYYLGRAEALCRESLRLFQQLGDTRGTINPLFVLGTVAQAKSDYTTARTMLEESLRLSKEIGYWRNSAYALYQLAQIVVLHGEYERARALAQEALALARSRGDMVSIMYALGFLAEIDTDQANYAAAQGYLDEAMEIARELDAKQCMSSLLRCRALVIFAMQEDAARTRALLEESLSLGKKIGFKGEIVITLLRLGQLALYQGDLKEAVAWLEEGRAIAKDLRERRYLLDLLLCLTGAVLQQGKVAQARSLLKESQGLLREVKDRRSEIVCLERLAEITAVRGELTQAVQLWGAAAAMRASLQLPQLSLPPFEQATREQTIEQARAQLEEEAFVSAWAGGQSMTPEQIRLAVGLNPAVSSALTKRELEVLRLLAQGLTNAGIAEQLVISPVTVSSYLRTIYGKLGVSSRKDALLYARDHQLL
jgi:predicted ATPase/DNA-binding CsgD family transcriptional regulator